MTTTVEVLADAFQSCGVPFIAGHPGGETVELMEAARQRGIRFVLMKQETAGAMMASTWGEITGMPGVCVSTRGPGAANMVNGIAYALLDRAPLLALTDQYPATVRETGLRQVIDQRRLYEPVTKWTTTVTANGVRQQIARAIRVATESAPGPVQLEMPADQTERDVPESAAPQPDPAAAKLELAIDPASLSPAVELVRRYKRPVLVAGLGVYWDKASSQLVALAELLGAPVLVTTKCKGAIPEDHPLRAGCIIGGIIERELVESADLIITVGLDSVEMQPKPWPYSLPVLSLANPRTLDALVPTELEVVGNLRAILDALTSQLPQGSDWGIARAKAFRERVSSALDIKTAGLSPQSALTVARDVLPRDTIATCDAGASRLLVVQKWQSYGPREFLTSNGLGSMGYAVPGALGARFAWPDRPIVAFTGDGGFMMAVAELQTAVREKLRITVVVLDDAQIGMIRIKQELKSLPLHGVSLGGIDWESLAAGFGVECAVVETEHQLGDALAASLKCEGSMLIAARIDGSAYVDQFNALREL